MATITTRTITPLGGRDSVMALSSAAGVADSVDIQMPTEFPHCFLSIQLFDGAGDPIDVGTASGTFTVSVQTINSGVLEAPPTATLDASAMTTISWAGNTQRVLVTGDSLTSLTTWKVVVTANRS